MYRADAGEIHLHGKRVEITSPRDAIQHKIGMVHQQFLQIKSFTVLENVIIGTEVKNQFSLNLAKKKNKVRELCSVLSWMSTCMRSSKIFRWASARRSKSSKRSTAGWKS